MKLLTLVNITDNVFEISGGILIAKYGKRLKQKQARFVI